MSGSGGGSSGEVGFPDYLEQMHDSYLSNVANWDKSTINTLFATAIAANPYTSENAYDPATPVTALIAAATGFDTLVGNFVPATYLATAYNAADTGKEAIIDAVTLSTPDPAASAEISASVSAFGDVMDDEIETKVLPRFAGGMRDINAVMSSAYAVGAGIIEAWRDRDVAKYQGDLRMSAYLERDKILAANIDRKNELLVRLELSEREVVQTFTELAYKGELGRLEFEKAVAHYVIESNRIKIVAMKEQVDRDLEVDAKEAEWSLYCTKYVNDAIACISGASGSYIPDKPSSSVLGGALAGAGTGAMIGSTIPGGWGTAVGAGIGAILGAAGASMF